MGMARLQHEKQEAREPGFVRKLIATFGLRAKHLTKNWSALFSFTVGLAASTFVLEAARVDVPIYWYVLVLGVTAGAVAIEIIYTLRDGK